MRGGHRAGDIGRPESLDVGDDEIPIEHTIALHRGLPNAQLAVLPETGHGDIDLRVVIRFLIAVEEES